MAIGKELQELVSWSVALLGDAIKTEYGEETYNVVEAMRKRMKLIRGKSHTVVYKELSQQLEVLGKYSDQKVHELCSSYSLMLELINRCENSYRAYKLEHRDVIIPKQRPHAIIFVLTAHPTEARSPELLGLFENIQAVLIQALKEKKEKCSDKLFQLLLFSLKVSLARKFKPTVADEASNIYSYILKEDVIDTLVSFARNDVNVSLRSWVGGDKDGHPGVNERTLHNSLGQSRLKIVSYIENKLKKVHELLSFTDQRKITSLMRLFERMSSELNSLKSIKNADGARVKEFRKTFQNFLKSYISSMKSSLEELEIVEKVIWIFPALVVALEVREDSELVEQALNSDTDFAIIKMLKKLKDISHGYDPKWYVRGFVLSMVESASDVQNGIKLSKKILGKYAIPVVPLFENEKALTHAKEILETTLSKNKQVVTTHLNKWGSRYEVMVGYSDSSKENGVLPSRLMISEALKKIETVLKKYELTPVFFHGSGGSIERGGGSVKEQTGWWPKSAINIYKATIQGEMVARNFGSPHILSKQIQVIMEQVGDFKPKKKISLKPLEHFSEKIRTTYSQKIKNDDFLSVIELATPYSFLHHLKIGSRPSKRAGGSIKNNLRAIPWILCWTQTRILFPTWWGVGSAWKQSSTSEQNEIKEIYKNSPVLLSYVKALGFTLAKIELGVWKLYLERSSIDKDIAKNVFEDFETELKLAKEFFYAISGEKEFLWFRTWLQQSIDYRSSMIHPLNLCQLESLRRGDKDLLRNSVTGIACGMLTTG